MLARQLLVWTALTAAILAGVAAVILAAFGETAFASGVVCGWAIGLASFAGLHWGIRRATTGQRGNLRSRSIVMLNIGKYTILGAAFWILLQAGVSGAGLAVGLGVVYFSLTVCGIRQARRLRDIEEI